MSVAAGALADTPLGHNADGASASDLGCPGLWPILRCVTRFGGFALRTGSGTLGALNVTAAVSTHTAVAQLVPGYVGKLSTFAAVLELHRALLRYLLAVWPDLHAGKMLHSVEV